MISKKNMTPVFADKNTVSSYFWGTHKNISCMRGKGYGFENIYRYHNGKEYAGIAISNIRGTENITLQEDCKQCGVSTDLYYTWSALDGSLQVENKEIKWADHISKAAECAKLDTNTPAGEHQ